MEVELTLREIEILSTVLNNDQRRCIRDGNHYEKHFDLSMAKGVRKRAELLGKLALRFEKITDEHLV